MQRIILFLPIILFLTACQSQSGQTAENIIDDPEQREAFIEHMMNHMFNTANEDSMFADEMYDHMNDYDNMMNHMNRRMNNDYMNEEGMMDGDMMN